jgi:cytoskeletal protein RodZ
MHESLGSKLRYERERRKIDLNSIAEATKISVALLQGLERDDVKRWPSGIFRKSFIKSYAAAVGLDPEAVLKEFIETFPDPMDPVPAAADAAAPKPAGRARVAAFTSGVRARITSAVGSAGGAASSVIAAVGSVAPNAGAVTSALRAARSSATATAASASSATRSASLIATRSATASVSASSTRVATTLRSSTRSMSASFSGWMRTTRDRISTLPKPKLGLRERVSSTVARAASLPARLSGAVRQLPPVSVRFTIISTGATFTNESFLGGMRRRVAAAACDIGISCALAMLLFIGVGSFWTPLGVSMMCYYVGGIVILGNTPGVCLFAPVRESGRQPTT